MPFAVTRLMNNQESLGLIDLKDLSTHEFVLLCRIAGEVCSRRYAQIAEASFPQDLPLQELLARMSNEAQVQVRTLRNYEDREPEGSEPGKRLAEFMSFIRNSISSLSKHLGEGFLPRDISLFLAESLEEEASSFYRKLAEHTPIWSVSNFFFSLSERERSKVKYLREVVLQG